MVSVGIVKVILKLLSFLVIVRLEGVSCQLFSTVTEHVGITFTVKLDVIIDVVEKFIKLTYNS